MCQKRPRQILTTLFQHGGRHRAKRIWPLLVLKPRRTPLKPRHPLIANIRAQTRVTRGKRRSKGWGTEHTAAPTQDDNPPRTVRPSTFSSASQVVLKTVTGHASAPSRDENAGVTDALPPVAAVKAKGTVVDLPPPPPSHQPSQAQPTPLPGTASSRKPMMYTRAPPQTPVLLPQYRYCHKDGFQKPLRAHHCRACGTVSNSGTCVGHDLTGRGLSVCSEVRSSLSMGWAVYRGA